MWFIFALGSALFAALTSILAKVGIEGVNSTLATAIRTVVVLAMSWGMVFLTRAQGAWVRSAAGVGSSSSYRGWPPGRPGCATTGPCSLAGPLRWCPSTSSAW